MLWITLTREVSILGHEGAETWLSTLTFPLSAWKSARSSFRSWSVLRAEWTVPWRLWHKEEKRSLVLMEAAVCLARTVRALLCAHCTA